MKVYIQRNFRMGAIASPFRTRILGLVNLCIDRSEFHSLPIAVFRLSSYCCRLVNGYGRSLTMYCFAAFACPCFVLIITFVMPASSLSSGATPGICFLNFCCLSLKAFLLVPLPPQEPWCTKRVSSWQHLRDEDDAYPTRQCSVFFPWCRFCDCLRFRFVELLSES